MSWKKRKKDCFRTVLFISALTLLFLTIGWDTRTASAADPFVGNIKAIEKESSVLRVRILRGGMTDAPTATIGDAVFQGDTIRTDEGVRIQVDLADGSSIFIGPGSNVQMKNFVVTPTLGKRQMTIKALHGTIRFLVSKLFRNKALNFERTWQDSAFNVETSTAIAGVKGTDFVVSIEDDGVEVAVFEGVVSVKNAVASVAGEIMVASNQVTRVTPGVKPLSPGVLTPQMRDKLLRATTPAKVMAPGSKSGTGNKMDKSRGRLGIARDLAAGIPLKEIMIALVKDGVSLQELITAAIEEGVDPSYVVFTAVSEGYPAQNVVSAALRAGAPINGVVSAAVFAGADTMAIYIGGADAGAPPSAMANEIATATAPGSPVYGYTAPTDAQPGVYTPPPPLPLGISGGGATPSSKPASPYKP